MKKEDIHIDDLYRILHGNIPLDFYFEIFIRSIVVYLLIAFGMRYMRKRITSELNRTELAGMATLAAATGLIILAPDRGILPAIIVFLVLILFKRIVDRKNYRNEKFEYLTEGHISVLVKDGVLQLDEMEKTRITQEQLFAQLRSGEIIHLGTVKRLYLEVSGGFSILESTEPRPGLAVIPDWDKDFLAEQKKSPDKVCCRNCGSIYPKGKTICNTCGNETFNEALIDK